MGVLAGKRYRHFKGGEYEIVCIAYDSETQQEMVVYRAIYGDKKIWVRPKEMFFGEVERDGKVLKRFSEVEDKAENLKKKNEINNWRKRNEYSKPNHKRREATFLGKGRRDR